MSSSAQRTFPTAGFCALGVRRTKASGAGDELAEDLLGGRVRREPVRGQAGLQQAEGAPDGVAARELALDVHRAPVELLGDGVDLEAVLEGGQRTVEVAAFHPPLR